MQLQSFLLICATGILCTEVTAIGGLRLGLFNGDFRARRTPLQRPKKIYAPVLINIAPIHHHQSLPVLNTPTHLSSGRMASQASTILNTKSKHDFLTNTPSSRTHRLSEKMEKNSPKNDIVPFSKLRSNYLKRKNDIVSNNNIIDSENIPFLNFRRNEIINRRNTAEGNSIPFSKLRRNNMLLDRNKFVDYRNVIPLTKLGRNNMLFNRNDFVNNIDYNPLSNLRRNAITNNIIPFSKLGISGIDNRNNHFMTAASSRRNEFINTRNIMDKRNLNHFSNNPVTSLQNLLAHLKEFARSKIMTLRSDIGGLKTMNKYSDLFRNRRDKNFGIFDEPKGIFGSSSNLNEVRIPVGIENRPHLIKKLTNIIRKLIYVVKNIFQNQKHRSRK